MGRRWRLIAFGIGALALVLLVADAAMHVTWADGLWDLSVAVGLLTVGTSGIVSLLMERDRLVKERAQVATLLESAIEGMSDGFALWDENDRLVACNEAYRSFYLFSRAFMVPGISFEELVRRGAAAGQYPSAKGRGEDFVQELVAFHKGAAGAIERLLPDGRWVLARERRMANGGIVGIRTDVTALKAVQAKLAAAREVAEQSAEAAREHSARLEERKRDLRTQHRLFEAALNNMSHGLLMVDEHERLIVTNPRFGDLFGLGADDLSPGMTTRRLGEVAMASGKLDGALVAELRRHQTRLANSRDSGTFVAAAEEGQMIAVTQRPLAEGGWVAIYEDVTSQREAEHRARFLAHHDDLTQLPNRMRFRGEIESRLRLLRRGGPHFALLYIDLDRFKDVNDTFGHQTGDALLGEAARRLRSCLREEDLVARLGGDEFAVLCSGVVSPDELHELGDEIIRVLTQPFDILGRSLKVGASIGIGVASREEADGEELLKRADLALYQAKSTGRGQACLFEPSLELRRRNRVALQEELREAIDNEAFSVAYQPIFDFATNRVGGFEALVRWHHPVRGWVSPADFIPVAEEAGLVDEIGTWVLRTACRDVARLPGSAKVAVNLSAQQLRTDAIVGIVEDALRESELPPGRLELEITETALLTNDESCAGILKRLSDLGLRIALDDFGTGYSSLSHLRQFPLDKIKIDKSFVREMATNPDSAAIVTSLAQLATKLGMTTTAEGIETIDQLTRVRLAGCTEGQGYLLGKPVSILHAIETLASAPPSALIEHRRRRTS